MHLHLGNIKSWAKDEFAHRCGPRVLRSLIHDQAMTCPECREVFSAHNDMQNTDEGWVCEECFGEIGFDPIREWGTHNRVRGL